MPMNTSTVDAQRCERNAEEMNNFIAEAGRRLTAALLALATVITQIAVSPAGAQSVGKATAATSVELQSEPQPKVDWSRAVVESTMKRYPKPADLGAWAYAKTLFLFGEYLVWKRTGDPRYLDYIKKLGGFAREQRRRHRPQS